MGEVGLKDKPKAEKTKFIPRERACPLCRMDSNVYNTTGRKQYRRCQNCGHTWTTIKVPEGV